MEDYPQEHVDTLSNVESHQPVLLDNISLDSKHDKDVTDEEEFAKDELVEDDELKKDYLETMCGEPRQVIDVQLSLAKNVRYLAERIGFIDDESHTCINDILQQIHMKDNDSIYISHFLSQSGPINESQIPTFSMEATTKNSISQKKIHTCI